MKIKSLGLLENQYVIANPVQPIYREVLDVTKPNSQVARQYFESNYF